MQEYLLPSLLMCTENKRCRSKIHSGGKVTRQMPKVIHRKSLQAWIHSYLMSPPVLSLKGKRPFKTIPVGFHWNVHLCKYKYPGPTVSAVSGRCKMVITDTSFFTIKTSPANATSTVLFLWSDFEPHSSNARAFIQKLEFKMGKLSILDSVLSPPQQKDQSDVGDF